MFISILIFVFSISGADASQSKVVPSNEKPKSYRLDSPEGMAIHRQVMQAQQIQMAQQNQAAQMKPKRNQTQKLKK